MSLLGLKEHPTIICCCKICLPKATLKYFVFLQAPKNYISLVDIKDWTRREGTEYVGGLEESDV